jgi:hypothetical protein
LLTAALVFVPLTAWLGYAMFGADRLLSYKAMALLLFCGVLAHVILAGGLVLFLKGFISRTTMVLMESLTVGCCS